MSDDLLKHTDFNRGYHTGFVAAVARFRDGLFCGYGGGLLTGLVLGYYFWK